MYFYTKTAMPSVFITFCFQVKMVTYEHLLYCMASSPPVRKYGETPTISSNMYDVRVRVHVHHALKFYQVKKPYILFS